MTDPATSLPDHVTSLPGYSSRCRACNSPHRTEVDRRLLAGDSARAVSSWLTETHGERLPHQGLLNHLNAHLDVAAEAAKIVESAAPVFSAAVDKAVADVGVLDEVASIGLRVARALEKTVSDPASRPSQPLAAIFAAALTNARAAVTDRHELLYGKKLEVSGVGPSTEDSAEDLHRRTAAALAAANGGADPGAVGGASAREPG